MSKFKAQQSIALTSIAKQTFGSQISDKDMDIVAKQSVSLWKSDAFNMEKVKQSLAKQISVLNGKITGIGGIGILKPSQKKSISEASKPIQWNNEKRTNGKKNLVIVAYTHMTTIKSAF